MNHIDRRREKLIAREAAKPGLRGKVNAMCIACIFDPEGGGGTWRQQVEGCTAPKCPLFSVRPMPSYEAGEEIKNTVSKTGDMAQTENAA